MDLWIRERRLLAYMRAGPKAGEGNPAARFVPRLRRLGLAGHGKLSASTRPKPAPTSTSPAADHQLDPKGGEFDATGDWCAMRL